MSAVIREICALSILCGVLCSMMPDGSVKRVAGILCSCVLIITAISPLRDLDFDYYARLITNYREREAEIARRGDEISERLNRTVIQAECEAYISDKAEKLGLTIESAKVELEWSADSAWVPYSAKISADITPAEREKLADVLLAELGIQPERVEWIDSGGAQQKSGDA